MVVISTVEVFGSQCNNVGYRPTNDNDMRFLTTAPSLIVVKRKDGWIGQLMINR